MKKVIIVGAGFAGLNAAKILGKSKQVEVLVIDKSNHHLFQPLLYQVAMAGLSPAEISAPIRAILSGYKHISVLQEEVIDINTEKSELITSVKTHLFDYLLLACGARHTYFGKNEWEEFAPGLKSIEQATEIRRRVLTSFEIAERSSDKDEQKKALTFIIVGAGPTGVELAGAIGEMSRYTLTKDFRNIDPSHTRIILVEAGERILAGFDSKLATKASRSLEKLGVQIWTNSRVSAVDQDGIEIARERIYTSTVLWAAGVEASSLGKKLNTELDISGRVIVNDDLSIPNNSNIFVAGDMANFSHQGGKPLVGQSPVAMQEGRFVAKSILNDLKSKKRTKFHFVDKGQMATIGRSKAICELGSKMHFSGFPAWIIWLTIHIYYLTGFKNRLLVVIQWGWSYLTFKRGARLIIDKDWQFYKSSK